MASTKQVGADGVTRVREAELKYGDYGTEIDYYASFQIKSVAIKAEIAASK